MSHPTVAQLRPVDLFDALDDEQLANVAAFATMREHRKGELIADHTSGEQAVYLILEGVGEAFTTSDGREDPAGEHVAPTWIGAIATLTSAPLGVRIVAGTDVRLAAIPAEDFVELAVTYRSIMQAVLTRVRPVVGRITAMEQNRERLESLGTMAAGLAHELNNPAAAARRAACDLAESLEVLSSTIDRFVSSGVERSEAQQLVDLQHEALERRKSQPPTDALTLADAEESLLERLEELGVEEAWRLSEPLASAGLDEQWLARVSALAGTATPAALRWVAASLSARTLAAELTESTARMSELVGAVKSYAYMDRGAVVEADVHEGLDTTLTILGHKLKHTSIEVVRDYDRTLAPLTMHGSELNQVWTNLLDNAIDALGERGTLTIATRSDGNGAVVDIADDGPGIPEDVRTHIFDPFFTTKDVGKGTGLGLDTARRIVVERHRGTLSVESRPGRTVFRVWLPLRQEVDG